MYFCFKVEHNFLNMWWYSITYLHCQCGL